MMREMVENEGHEAHITLKVRYDTEDLIEFLAYLMEVVEPFVKFIDSIDISREIRF
jgi:hypothetical protein